MKNSYYDVDDKMLAMIIRMIMVMIAMITTLRTSLMFESFYIELRFISRQLSLSARRTITSDRGRYTLRLASNKSDTSSVNN